MKILNDKHVRQSAIGMVVLMVVFILISQFTVMRMMNDFKKTMITHDDEIAGYLSQNGVDEQQIAKAFTAQHSKQDQVAGNALLTSSGYMEGTKTELLPEIENFHGKFALVVLIGTLIVSVAFIMLFYFFINRRDKRLIQAGDKLHSFMDGNTTIRLDDSQEDNLSWFFSSVNALATTLNTHAEKEQHHREFLKDTISDISHQLKTPLAALQMYNEIIIDEKTGNEVVENFTLKSQRELTRMENLIQNLLKLAKLDAGTIKLDVGAHKLTEFLDNCLGLFRTRAELEGKIVTMECDPSVELSFDEVWLGEAVGNIIKNALDHTSEGNQIDITCTDSVVATEIMIKDNGAGIHPDDIHYIFKRFYRSRYSKDKQGVGIGLPLAKSIVEQHKGTITVESKLGSGTTFHLIFPKLTNL